VTDRCTKSHEYLFLLTKSARYYFDAKAIAEEAQYGRCATFRSAKYENNNARENSSIDVESHGANTPSYEGGRNKRSVWTIPTQAFPEAHFATYPEKLVEPCISAGCPEEVCPKCGVARERILKQGDRIVTSERGKYGLTITKNKDRNECLGSAAERMPPGKAYDYTTTGFTDCGCGVGFEPGVVMDPFAGAATTGLVALKLCRSFVGIKLNPAYVAMAEKRIRDECGLLL
jgi:site-specific DNA-methyltransferase (adenine-specific)